MTPTAPHRTFSPADLETVALGLMIEQRYDITPAALAFGLRVLTDPAVRAHVTELGRRTGRLRPLPAMAMDFEKERAQRLLEQQGAKDVSRTGRNPERATARLSGPSS